MRVLVGVVDQEQLRARRRGRGWGDQRQGVWNVVHNMKRCFKVIVRQVCVKDMGGEGGCIKRKMLASSLLNL